MSVTLLIGAGNGKESRKIVALDNPLTLEYFCKQFDVLELLRKHADDQLMFLWSHASMIPLSASQCTIGREELPMTMQVGMVGSDGIVIAGDTRHYVEYEGRPWRSYSSSKIKLDNTGQIAIACARNIDISFRIADQIFAAIPSVAVEGRAGKIRDIGSCLAVGVDAECIVAISEPVLSIFFLQCDSKGDARCDHVDRCVAGDGGNPAYYWAERYYNRNLSMNQLVRLSAHIVVAAGSMNNGSVRGLEMVTLEASGFRKWSTEENDALESEITEEGKRIGEIVLHP